MIRTRAYWQSRGEFLFESGEFGKAAPVIHRFDKLTGVLEARSCSTPVVLGEEAARTLEGEVCFERAQAAAADEGLRGVEVFVREREIIAEAVEGGPCEEAARDVIRWPTSAQSAHGGAQIRFRGVEVWRGSGQVCSTEAEVVESNVEKRALLPCPLERLCCTVQHFGDLPILAEQVAAQVARE